MHLSLLLNWWGGGNWGHIGISDFGYFSYLYGDHNLLSLSSSLDRNHYLRLRSLRKYWTSCVQGFHFVQLIVVKVALGLVKLMIYLWFLTFSVNGGHQNFNNFFWVLYIPANLASIVNLQEGCSCSIHRPCL